MSRYIVTREGPLHKGTTTDVLLVRRAGQAPHHAVAVWRAFDVYGQAEAFSCCVCSGPLTAMKQSCTHACAARSAHRAKRIVDDERPPTKPRPIPAAQPTQPLPKEPSFRQNRRRDILAALKPRIAEAKANNLSVMVHPDDLAFILQWAELP